MKSALVFTLLLITTLANSQTTKLNLASDVWPPFTDVETHHAFALDLVQEALKRADVEEQTHILAFKKVMDGISSKKFDGSAALGKRWRECQHRRRTDACNSRNLIFKIKDW